MDLKIGYDRSAHPLEYRFQRMTFVEVATLRYGDRVWFWATDSLARGCKVNGAVKRWKTRPLDLRVPIKYGMYEYGTVEWRDGKPSDGVELLKLADDSCPFNA